MENIIKYMKAGHENNQSTLYLNKSLQEGQKLLCLRLSEKWKVVYKLQYSGKI
jgi:hypothetical protein